MLESKPNKLLEPYIFQYKNGLYHHPDIYQGYHVQSLRNPPGLRTEGPSYGPGAGGFLKRFPTDCPLLHPNYCYHQGKLGFRISQYIVMFNHTPYDIGRPGGIQPMNITRKLSPQTKSSMKKVNIER